MEDLVELMSMLFDLHLDGNDDRSVDLEKMKLDAVFRRFELASCELQKVNLQELRTRKQKLVFWINIYNILGSDTLLWMARLFVLSFFCVQVSMGDALWDGKYCNLRYNAKISLALFRIELKGENTLSTTLSMAVR
jgi:hypothetical protein